MYGYPPYPPPYMYYPFPQRGEEEVKRKGDKLSELREYSRFIKSLIAEEKRKGDSKDKKDKSKPKMFTVSELAGYIFLLWPVVGLGELLVIHYMLETLSTTFK